MEAVPADGVGYTPRTVARIPLPAHERVPHLEDPLFLVVHHRDVVEHVPVRLPGGVQAQHRLLVLDRLVHLAAKVVVLQQGFVVDEEKLVAGELPVRARSRFSGSRVSAEERRRDQNREHTATDSEDWEHGEVLLCSLWK